MRSLRAARCGRRGLGMVLVLILVPAVVLAHAYLARSSPRPGERLETAPKQLVLIFSKPVELAMTAIELWTMDEVAIPTSPPKAHATEKAGMFVDLPVLTPREYRVRWRTTSADGHPVQGSFRFTVLPPPGADTAAAHVEEEAHEEMMDSAGHMMMMDDDDADAVSRGLAGISIPRTVLRWLGFLALFAATGAAAFMWLVLPRLRSAALVEPATIAAVDHGIRSVGLSAALAMIVIVLPRLWSASSGVVSTDSPAIMTYAMSTATGRAMLGQIIAAVMTAIGFLGVRRSRRPGEILAAAGMAVAIIATSYDGHAAAAESPFLIAPLTILHVLASSVWFGMLLIVVTVAIPRIVRSQQASPVPALAALIDGFSPVALTCGITTGAAGVVLGFQHIGSVAALLRSDYGRTLIVKVVIVLLVFGTGFYNWKRMKPALGDPAGSQRLARSATVELVIGALVLAATAVLVALPSPASLAP